MFYIKNCNVLFVIENRTPCYWLRHKKKCCECNEKLNILFGKNKMYEISRQLLLTRIVLCLRDDVQISFTLLRAAEIILLFEVNIAKTMIAKY